MLRHSLAVTTIAVVQFLPLSSRANAETIQCGAGDVQCLISAINQANVDPHNTTIHLAGGIYALTSLNNVANGPNGLPTITSPVTVEAGKDGATLARVEGAPGFRILRVGGSGRLTLEGITLTGGDATTFVPGDLLTISGGAILNAGGVVTASNTVFDGNSSEEFGGAIFSNNGNLSIDNSTFSGNVSSFGGGLSIRGGSVKITRTTFDNNYAPGAAGGVWTENATTYISQSRFEENGGGHAVGGVLVRGGTASINESTFKRNVSDPAGALWADSQALVTVLNSAFVENRGAGGGSGILNAANVNVINTTFARNVGGSISFLGIAILNVGTMTLINTTFAENTTYGGNGPGTQPASVISSGPTATTALQNTILVHNTQDLYLWDCYGGTFVSLGNNVIGDPSPCNMSIQLTDRLGDAGLGNLVDDGTPGNAHFPLLPDSQAIDGANAAACPKKDQIGRPRTAHCDIGAVEFINGLGHLID